MATLTGLSFIYVFNASKVSLPKSQSSQYTGKLSYLYTPVVHICSHFVPHIFCCNSFTLPSFKSSIIFTCHSKAFPLTSSATSSGFIPLRKAISMSVLHIVSVSICALA